MIVVNARIDIDPQNIEALKPAIAAMEEASRAEAGCEEYTFSVDLNDPSVLRVTERWKDSEALDLHMASEHMAQFRTAMASHPPKGLNAHFYEATEVAMPGS